MNNQTDKKKPKEKVVETADYRRAKIHVTNYGRYFVEINGLSYPAGSLQSAKDMIDRLRNDQRN